MFILHNVNVIVLGARNRFQLQIRCFKTLATIDTLRQSETQFLWRPFASAVILNAQDDPVTNDQIMHAVTKLTTFRGCTKGGDKSINAFVFQLIPGVESVPFKSFVQFSYSEFVETFVSPWPLKILSPSTLIQWRNNATLYAGSFVSS